MFGHCLSRSGRQRHDLLRFRWLDLPELTITLLLSSSTTSAKRKTDNKTTIANRNEKKKNVVPPFLGSHTCRGALLLFKWFRRRRRTTDCNGGGDGDVVGLALPTGLRKCLSPCLFPFFRCFGQGSEADRGKLHSSSSYCRTSSILNSSSPLWRPSL